MSDILLTEQTSASATPASGRVVIYPKTDGYLYFKDDVGVETRINTQNSNTAAGWTAANPTLAAGVFGVELDTMRFKIGDGTTPWNSLAYWRYTAEHITIPTTGGTTVLTIPQSRAASMAVTGVLVSNAIIVTPDTMALFVAENLTTGAFTVTFKTAAGTGIVVPQGSHVTLYADGVNIENPVTAGAGSGDVVGPASAVGNNFASYDGITGKLIKDSGSNASSFEPANANIQSHISSTSNPHAVTKTQVGLGNCDNTSDANKPVSTAQAAADTAAENNAKAYADTLVLGLLDDRGNYDASVNTFPASGGSGTAGAVMKGDMWRISVAGTLGGEAVAIGDAVRALSDAPGQTASNWAVMLDSATTAAEVTCTTQNVGNSTNLDTFIANLDASQTAQKDSGFESWTGSGDYYSIAASQLTLLRGGVGYIKGKRATWTAPQTTGTLAVNSAHWIYIDTNGTIGSSTSRTEALYQDNIILFEAHNDGTNIEVVVENHACSFDTDSGHLFHDVIGTVLTPVSGTNVVGADVTRVATGTGGAAGDRQIKIVGTADINDQGLVTNVPDSAGAAISWVIYYKNALGNWTEYATQTQMPMIYNNAGTPTALATSGSTDTGVFVAYAIKAEPNSGLPLYILIMDDAVYATDATALASIAAGTIEIADGTLFQALEPVRLGYVVVTNNVSGGYISTLQISKQVGASSVGGGAGASSASSIPTNTINFTGGLSSSDSNVQQALDTLDKLERYGADVVAAATTDLSATTGGYVHITGNTGITSFGTHTAGHLHQLVFDGTPLITHSANLILPGAVNIQIVAGDSMIVRSEGNGTGTGSSGNIWRCIAFTPYTVTGTGGGVRSTAPTLTNPTLNAGGGVLVLPQTTVPSQTAEGSISWDTDNDLLTVGDGSSRKTMVDTDTAQTLSNKTLTTLTSTGNSTIGDSAIFDAHTINGKSTVNDIRVAAITAAFPAITIVDHCFHLERDDTPRARGWRRRKGQSWRSEARSVGTHCGSYATATLAVAAGAIVGDVYYNTTSSAFHEVTGSTTSTATYRAGREDYPTNALITAEAARVIIWDLDGAAPSMWSTYASTNINCVFAIDNSIIYGRSSGGNYKINFISDSLSARSNSLHSLIADKLGTSAVHTATWTQSSYISANYLVNNTVNDITAIVLPNAPIDEYGMPVPTIFCSTAAGVSVINNNGVVADLVDVAGDATYEVALDKNNNVYFTNSTQGDLDMFLSTNYDADDTTPDANYDNTTIPALLAAITTTKYGLVQTGKGLAVGHNTGVSRLVPSTATKANGMVAYISSTYNTGWMTGDIRHNFLCNSKTADRSISAATLTEVGTVTETTYSGGRSVYSGFSAANYLQIASAATFNALGTGDFSIIIGAAKFGTLSVARCLISLGDGASDGSFVLILNSGNALSFRHYYTAALNTVLTSTATFTDTSEHTIELSRSTVSGVANTVQIKVDGVVVASGVDANTVSNATGYLRIGQAQHTDWNWAGGQCSCVRISATAPTTEQSKFIAATENALNGGHACLLSNSSTVSQLDYYSRSDMLAVGNGTNTDFFNNLAREGVITTSTGATVSGTLPSEAVIFHTGTTNTVRVGERNVEAELTEQTASIPKTLYYSFTSSGTTQALPQGWKARGVAFNLTDGTMLAVAQTFDGFVWTQTGLTNAKAYQVELEEV